MIEVLGSINPCWAPNCPWVDPMGCVVIAGFCLKGGCDANALGTSASNDFGFNPEPSFAGGGLAKLPFGIATRFLGERVRLLNDSMLAEAGLLGVA